MLSSSVIRKDVVGNEAAPFTTLDAEREVVGRLSWDASPVGKEGATDSVADSALFDTFGCLAIKKKDIYMVTKVIKASSVKENKLQTNSSLLAFIRALHR